MWKILYSVADHCETGMTKNSSFSLTKLEGEVMSAVWDAQPDPVCVRDVVESLNSARSKTRRKKLAYNTVQTVLTLLKQKKVVRQVQGRGRAHYFIPCLSRIEASRHILSDLSNRVFGGQLKPLIHQMIDGAELTAEELAELRQWVDAKLKDAKP